MRWGDGVAGMERAAMWPRSLTCACRKRGKHAIPTRHDSGPAAAMPPRLQPTLKHSTCSKPCQQGQELQNQRAGAP